MTVWQLSMGREDLPFIQGFLKNPMPNTFNYEKGSANMQLMPKIGDLVMVTCQAKLRCTGTIYREAHPSYNPNTQSYGYFLTVLVDYVFTDPPYMKGRRRNWTVVKDCDTGS